MTSIKMDVVYANHHLQIAKTKLKIEVLNKIHCYKSLNKAPKMYTKPLRTLKSKFLHNKKF